jgi:hypothetical protein
MNPQPEDNTSDTSRAILLQQIVQMSIAHGAVVVEHVTCERCKKSSVAFHAFQEAVRCEHCGMRTPSGVPRRPQPGEVQLEHVSAAIATLRECYGLNPLNKWSTQDEWAKFSPEQRDAITRNMSAAAVAVLQQVDNLACALATKAPNGIGAIT